jgi:hypothetical protein
MSRLEKALKSSKEAEGKTLKIVNKVNPAVLGGLLVDFGDKTSMCYNLSLRHTDIASRPLCLLQGDSFQRRPPA